MTREAIIAELESLDARRDELNQLLADLDSGQVTARQIANYPIVSGFADLAGETFLSIPATLAKEAA